jgi:hypothetical protein
MADENGQTLNPPPLFSGRAWRLAFALTLTLVVAAMLYTALLLLNQGV